MAHPSEAHAPARASVTPLPRIATGNTGLDQVLLGGLPKGRTTLFSGGAGCWKSILALEFLVRGALDGKPGILVPFEERVDAVRDNALTLGWDLAEEKEARDAVELRRASAAVEAKKSEIARRKAELEAETARLSAGVELAESELAQLEIETHKAAEARTTRLAMRGGEADAPGSSQADSE